MISDLCEAAVLRRPRDVAGDVTGNCEPPLPLPQGMAPELPSCICVALGISLLYPNSPRHYPPQLPDYSPYASSVARTRLLHPHVMHSRTNSEPLVLIVASISHCLSCGPGVRHLKDDLCTASDFIRGALSLLENLTTTQLAAPFILSVSTATFPLYLK